MIEVNWDVFYSSQTIIKDSLNNLKLQVILEGITSDKTKAERKVVGSSSHGATMLKHRTIRDSSRENLVSSLPLPLE